MPSARTSARLRRDARRHHTIAASPLLIGAASRRALADLPIWLIWSSYAATPHRHTSASLCRSYHCTHIDPLEERRGLSDYHSWARTCGSRSSSPCQTHGYAMDRHGARERSATVRYGSVETRRGRSRHDGTRRSGRHTRPAPGRSAFAALSVYWAAGGTAGAETIGEAITSRCWRDDPGWVALSVGHGRVEDAGRAVRAGARPTVGAGEFALDAAERRLGRGALMLLYGGASMIQLG